MDISVSRTSAGASDGLRLLGRIGLASRGAVYVLVGWLALAMAFGDRSKEADREGALATLARQPYGKVLLLAAAVGFAGYALWRAAEAVTGQTSSKSDAGAWKRSSSAAKAILYGTFAVSTAKFALTNRHRSGSEKDETLTATVLSWPGGRLIVAVAGIAIVGAGIFNIYRGITGAFMKHLKKGELGDVSESTVRAIGTAGHIGRGVGFALVGVFVALAALRFDASRARGLDGALKELADDWYGPFVLVALAIGFAAFGIYSLAEARWRRVLGG